jgi:hypothetical protein
VCDVPARTAAITALGEQLTELGLLKAPPVWAPH